MKAMIMIIATLIFGVSNAQTLSPQERIELKNKIEQLDNFIAKNLRTSGFPCDKFIGSSDTFGNGKQLFACVADSSDGSTAAYIVDTDQGIQQFERPCAKVVTASVSGPAPYKALVSCFASDTDASMRFYVIDLGTGRFID